MAHPETFFYSGKELEKGCEDDGFIPLPIVNKHAVEIETLVSLENASSHKDPFDRLLLAQAEAERMKFMKQRYV